MWITAGISCKGQEDTEKAKRTRVPFTMVPRERGKHPRRFFAKRCLERRSEEFTAGARLAALIVSAATGHGTIRMTCYSEVALQKREAEGTVHTKHS